MINIAKKVYKKLILDKKEETRYKKWVQQCEKEALEYCKINRLPTDICFSIVIPPFRTPDRFLNELIESIQKQTYDNWELILSDGSGNDQLTEYLKKYESDKRIKVIKNEKALDISENTNRALKETKGDYIVFADHDDLLPAHALYQCAKAIYENEMPDLIYSDEDKISMDGTRYFQPHFKPDFNLGLLRSMNYFCHLVVVKKELQQKVGALNSKYNGAQDYDFVLRCVEQAKYIYHIPEILYHWRSHSGSIAGGGENKEYAFEAGRQALLAHFERCGIHVNIEKDSIFGIYHVEYLSEKNPLISVVSNKVSDLQMLMKQGSYENYEIIEDEKITEASGEYLLFLNGSISTITTGWLRKLIGDMEQNKIGIVGTKMIYNSDKYIHAGIVLGGERIVNYVADRSQKAEVGYMGRYICEQEYSAVSGICILVDKKCFDIVNGFDERLTGELKYVDLCLKIRKAGYKIYYEPKCEVNIIEKMGREIKGKEYFSNKWKDFLNQGDSYYNKNLDMNNLFTLKKETRN